VSYNAINVSLLGFLLPFFRLVGFCTLDLDHLPSFPIAVLPLGSRPDLPNSQPHRLPTSHKKLFPMPPTPSLPFPIPTASLQTNQRTDLPKAPFSRTCVSPAHIPFFNGGNRVLLGYVFILFSPLPLPSFLFVPSLEVELALHDPKISIISSPPPLSARYVPEGNCRISFFPCFWF